MTPLDYVDVRRHDLCGNTYRPQREWVEGRGILLPTAHFFSSVGAGTWAVSLLFDFREGLIMALLIMGVLSGMAHLLFLGRFSRFWRMLKRPRTSWISRGLWGIALFLAGGTGYVVSGTDGGLFSQCMLGISLVGMATVLLYEGFVYTASKGIPFWNTRLIPVLYVAYGLRGGAALLLVAASMGRDIVGLDAMEAIKLWVVVSTGVLVLFLLISGKRAGGAAARSVQELVAGSASPAFYGGTVLIGIILPIALGLVHGLEGFGLPVIGLLGVTSLMGDFYIKFCVVKAGMYAPLTAHGGGRALETAG